MIVIYLHINADPANDFSSSSSSSSLITAKEEFLAWSNTSAKASLMAKLKNKSRQKVYIIR
jgi:hypothetical protein